MAQFTGLLAQNLSTNAASWEAARQVTRRQPRAIAYQQSTSFTPSGLFGGGGSNGEPELLASCYRRSLEVAAGKGVISVAFPSISTGIYGYPIALAARVAVNTVRESLGTASSIQEVVFCCFSPEDLQHYESILSESAA